MQKAIAAQMVDFPGAYILVSARRRQDDPSFIKATMSFLFADGDYAAEWEPEYGPIQKWHKCEKDAPDAKPHFFFDFTDNKPGEWSQTAVDSNGLKDAFLAGNYYHIFSVLQNWACE
jgi:hypothetical protein